jgi:RHS repeat-associated protein
MRDTRGGAEPLVYYELDLAGNVRRLRAPGGADLGGYEYAAFGAQVAPDAGTPAPGGLLAEQPWRWKGRWWSPRGGAAGTYDVRARTWSPELGVFLSIDEFAYHDARSTLWAWPGQNPYRWSDPTGHRPDGAAQPYNDPNFVLGSAIGWNVGVLAVAMVAAPWWVSVLGVGATVQNHDEMGKFVFAVPAIAGAAGDSAMVCRGARGKWAGRDFDPANAGGPIRSLTTEGVRVAPKGVDVVEGHLARFGSDAANEAMLARLRDIAAGKMPAT